MEVCMFAFLLDPEFTRQLNASRQLLIDDDDGGSSVEVPLEPWFSDEP